MKKIAAVLILCTVSGISGINVSANNTDNINLAVQSDSVVFNVNGINTKYEVKWNKEHNRIMVDSDFIKKYFEAEIETIGNKMIIKKNGHTLEFEKDNEFYTMDNLGGRKVGVPEVINNKMYLPVRYICEAFGSEIKYNQLNKSVDIKTNAIVLDESVKEYFNGVQVFDQSTIKIKGDKTVYFDPRRIKGNPQDADIIFITHTHNDHYEIESIRKVIKPSTIVYIPKDGVEQAMADGLTNIVGIEPNQEYNEGDIKFSTVLAYNTAKDRQNHKKEYNWVGYIAEINGYTYYSAGDTDFTDEMITINKDIDVAFLPIDGKYNMGVEEAAKAANTIKPKVAVPYHYNNFVSEEKAQEFTSLLDKSIKGAIITFKMQ